MSTAKTKWITMYELAGRFGICKRTARKLVKAKKFKTLKLFNNNSTIRILLKDVETYENQNKKIFSGGGKVGHSRSK